jgi:hypothetical protein
MEAGIEPASHPVNNSNLYETIIELSKLCVSLSEISYHATDSIEQNLVKNLLATSLSQIGTIIAHLNFSKYTKDFQK